MITRIVESLDDVAGVLDELLADEIHEVLRRCRANTLRAVIAVTVPDFLVIRVARHLHHVSLN